jgi:exopolysaccharide biosynthesis polyprenyl glycosylphosphotransferase
VARQHLGESWLGQAGRSGGHCMSANVYVGAPTYHAPARSPASRGQRVAKAVLDRGLGLFALTLLAPLMVVVVIAIRLTSRGPALFWQRRVGRDGIPFVMLKFRSMYVDAESRLEELVERNDVGDGLLFKMRNDPRTTPIGRWLRRYSLDELPQLLNVIGGSMSLVGPRPPLPAEVASYDDELSRRLLVKPGMTGLWQISGRSDLPWQEAIRLDLRYVDSWSITVDLVILWKTVSAVATGVGAY